MVSNAEAAEIFRNIADLLDVLGEKFKPEAYRRAARSIETLAEELAKVAARNELRTIPGIGEAIEEKIREYLSTGQIHYYERLKREVPPGVVELMRLPGLGPKTARRFWVELGLEGPNELSEAIAKGRLDHIKVFGPKRIEQIATALREAHAAPVAGGARSPIEVVYPVAERIVRALRAVSGTEAVEVAGSFRRRRETVGDLDILATSSAPAQVFDTFSALSEVKEVRLRGGTKETVVLASGLQVDLRVVEPAAFGAALQYFTGSKDHNVHLRTIARDRGLKINEYGVFRGEERIGGRTEVEVYATLGLPWIPPELREDHGEIEAAANGALPTLVAADDLTGDLHLHLPVTATAADVERLYAAARRRHVRYLGFVVAGVDPEGHPFRLPGTLLEHLRSARPKGVEIHRAIEVGAGPVPSEVRSMEAEYRIVRPTVAFPEPNGRLPEGPPLAAVAHLGGGAVVPPETVRRWIDWAKAQGVAVEVGPGPERLDSTWARVLAEAKVPLLIPTGVESPEEDPTGPLALGFARRAGTETKSVRVSGPGAPSGRRELRSVR